MQKQNNTNTETETTDKKSISEENRKKKLEQLEQCSAVENYKKILPLYKAEKPDHYQFTFVKADDTSTIKELCIVKSKYIKEWEGRCSFYVPDLCGVTPKGQVHFLSLDQDNCPVLGSTLPRVYVGNTNQVKRVCIQRKEKVIATLVVNFYPKAVEGRAEGEQLFPITKLPFGQKVNGKVVIQKKQNEKGNQVIVDCYVDPSKPKSKNEVSFFESQFFCVQENKPKGMEISRAYKIPDEDRRIMICKVLAANV